ncbi:sepiapterin reductase-like [Polypterus senegalus]|uniref:sepiapterin reductase-like n=1 Tax=Polypterus senegalus TaxID=55291 RepID=UPI00196641AC|nr:sepiapterin reductase-like [Polypterus senegalus]
MEAIDLGKALCVVTGASRGFGHSLALHLSTLLKSGSMLVVIARSEGKLRELQAEIRSSGVTEETLQIKNVAADLGKKEGLQEVVRVLTETETSSFNHMLLINNAASLGDISKFVVNLTELEEVDQYFSFNFSSALCLTASLLKHFVKRPGLKRTIVNISSLCALKPFKSWSLYCSSKAARNMLFQVLAEENPDIRVLNYAPGPLDTEMQVAARSQSGDSELRETCARLHESGQLISCSQSTSKLVHLLLKDQFKSGCHIDFYDV